MYNQIINASGEETVIKFNHVRFILNSKCVWFVNHNYIPYYFKL